MAESNTTVLIPDLDWYRDIIENAPETIIIIDQNGTILFHNALARGMNPQDFIGHSIYEYFLPEFHDLVRGKIEQVFATGDQETYELASTYKSDETIWYTTRLSPIRRNDQVVAVTLFIRDTTIEKQSQLALNEINENLEKIVDQRTRTINQHAHRLEEVEKLSVALRKANSTQAVTEILADHCKRLFDVDLAGVYLLRDGKLNYSISLGKTEPPPILLTADKDPFLFSILETNAIRYIPLRENTIHPGCSFCAYIREQGIKSLVVAPLHTGDTIVGALYLGSRDTRDYITEEEQLISAFVESSSNTLHRIQLMEQLKQNIEQQKNELRILYNVMSIASEELDSETLLSKSLSTTLAAVHCDIGVIHLMDVLERKLKVSAEQNLPPSLYNYLLLSGTAETLWEKVFADQDVILIRRLKSQSYDESTRESVQLYDYLGVPIRVKDTIIGVLSLFNGSGLFLDTGQIQLIRTIADQIGLALETTSQRKRENEALIFEERQRLARELHDSVSQSLYGLVLAADVGNKLLKVKAYSELAKALSEIGDVALQSLKEMRLMLFELRPVTLETIGLAGALELRLNTVEERANIHTTLTVTGKEFIPRGYELEVYRIATEALNNSLKHSRASEVNVALSATPQYFELVIQDNGIGFDLGQKSAGGMGLITMHERSNRISGSLTIDSKPQTGTRVILTVPVPQAQPAQKEAVA